MSSPLEKENVFSFVWTLKVDKFKPTTHRSKLLQRVVGLQENWLFFPTNPNQLPRWTALNRDKQEGFVRRKKYETKNRQQPHELCFSHSNSPLSTAYSEKSHSQSDDVKGRETGSNFIDELLRCLRSSQSWTCEWLLSPRRFIALMSFKGERCLSLSSFSGLFVFLFIASSLSSSCYEIPFSIVNLFDVLI